MLLSFGAVLCLGFMGAFLFLQVLKSSELVCKLTTGESCPPDALVVLEPLRNKPLFFTAFSQELKQQFDGHPYSVQTLKKQLPHTLSIELAQHPPIGGIRVGGQLVVLTAEGGTFQGETPADLPEIEYLGTEESLRDPQVREVVLEALTAAAPFLQTENLPIQQLSWVSEHEVRAELQSGQLAVLDAFEVELQLQQLQVLLNSAELQETLETTQEIDLRFEHPVLRTRE